MNGACSVRTGSVGDSQQCREGKTGEKRSPSSLRKGIKYVDGASLYVLASHPAMPTTQRCIITAIGIK